MHSEEKRGEKLSDGSNLEDLNFSPVKFVSFPIISTGLDQSPENWNRSSLQNVFQTRDVVVSVNSENVSTNTFKCLKNHYIPRLNDEQLSASLEYLFKRTTAEVLKYLDKKFIEKKGVMIDGILYSKTRLLEGQSLRCVGGLENSFDIHSFTGINFNNPLILKESPMALAIGNHLH